MLNVSRPWSVRNLFFCLSLIACVSASTAHAQAPQTEWDRQLDRLELGATAIGIEGSRNVGAFERAVSQEVCQVYVS